MLEIWLGPEFVIWLRIKYIIEFAGLYNTNKGGRVY